MSRSASLPLVVYSNLTRQVEALERDGYARLPSVHSGGDRRPEG